MKTLLQICLMGFGSLILSGMNAQAQSNLELAINAEKEYYVLGEPVVIYVTLKNMGGEPVEVMRHLNPDYDNVRYFITGLDGEENPFMSMLLKEPAKPEQILPPNGSIRDIAKIFYGQYGWTFQAPGQYLIRAVYLNQVNSNTIAINISGPSSAEEKRASNMILESQDIGVFLTLEGGDHLVDAVDRLRTIATDLPNTFLASYANYALGVNLAHNFADFEKNRLREAAPQQAVQYLEKAKAAPIGLYYKINAYNLLSEGYGKLQKTMEAASATQELNQLIEKSPPVLRPWLEEYIKAQKSRQ